MENSTQMPYFIRPSKNLERGEKETAYQAIHSQVKAILENENNIIVKMATINSILKIHLPYAYWVGFYCMNNGVLKVGPYQGTIGCTTIPIGKGVCGTVAKTGHTKIVDDVHILTEGSQHITCDPNSQSEIVLPVYNAQQKLIAVLDIDSTLTHSFDEIDQRELERILGEVFG